jgi:hypothetical protein
MEKIIEKIQDQLSSAIFGVKYHSDKLISHDPEDYHRHALEVSKEECEFYAKLLNLLK